MSNREYDKRRERRDVARATRTVKVQLPDISPENMLAEEFPMCTTVFETTCCGCIVLLIAGCGLGIGIWYINVSS